MVCGSRTNVAVLGLAFILKDFQDQDDKPCQKEKTQGSSHFKSKFLLFLLEKVGNISSFFVSGLPENQGLKEEQ